MARATATATKTRKAKGKAADTRPAPGALVEVHLREIPMERIEPSPYQPRQSFPEEEIERLADSIRAQGLIHPIAVRPSPADPDRYELVDGERRWRAVGALGWGAILAQVGEYTDAQVMEIVVATAIHRRELNAIEEALAFRRAIDAGVAAGPTELARQLGLSQGHVSNRLRLLELPEVWKAKVISQEIPPTHARCLVRYAGHPSVLQAIGETLDEERQYSDNDGLLSVTRFEDLVETAVERTTRPLEGDHWERSTGRRLPVFTPTEEQRQQLGLVEMPLRTWDGKQQGSEARATNIELWDKLQAEHVRTLQEKRDKKASKKATKDGGEKLTAAEKKRLEAEERRKAADRERQFQARLDDWRANWLAYLIGRRLRTGATMQELVVIAMYFAGHSTSYRFEQDRAMDNALKTQGITSRQPGRLGEYDRLAFMTSLSGDDVEPVASLMLSAWFWSIDDEEPRRLMYDSDLPRLADYLGIDRVQAWLEEQAGPLSGAYWNLHDKQQLVALAGELGVEAAGSVKKADLVARLMGASVEMPAELESVKRPK